MINYYTALDTKEKLSVCGAAAKDCWIHLTAPTEEELREVSDLSGVECKDFRDALDEEESAHIEIDENYQMVVIDLPKSDPDNPFEISTIPLTIVITADYFITMCSTETTVLSDFFAGKIKYVETTKKTKLMYQLMHNTFIRFLYYLKKIDQASNQIQLSLSKSMQNKELLELLELQKSLVFFSASLSSNKSVVQKLASLHSGKLSEEEQDILEDVLIENKQAVEMCSVYREIIKNTMDTFSYIINNNQNFVMKLLTAITIILSVPMLFASWWGMNTPVPFEGNPYGFWLAVAVSMGITLLVAVIMRRRRML